MCKRRPLAFSAHTRCSWNKTPKKSYQKSNGYPHKSPYSPQLFAKRAALGRDPAAAVTPRTDRSHLFTAAPQHLTSGQSWTVFATRFYTAEKYSTVATEIESGAAPETLFSRSRSANHTAEILFPPKAPDWLSSCRHMVRVLERSPNWVCFRDNVRIHWRAMLSKVELLIATKSGALPSSSLVDRTCIPTPKCRLALTLSTRSTPKSTRSWLCFWKNVKR